MANTIDSRNIRVFISSTFRDMEEERNELVSKVFPLLRKMAKERQVTLSEIDLRWGITEKESQERKVVQICLEEIDRSHPFFIGVLGGRYGWCPMDEKVDWNSIISAKYEDAIHDLYEGKSMTELEIIHGAFRNKEDLHAAFYLRDMPSNEIEERQQKLREKVSSQKDFPVNYYKNTEELSALVLADFQSILDELYPAESCNTWEAFSMQQNYYLESLTRYYVANKEAESGIANFLGQDVEKGLILTGESGIGKSTIMAKAVMNIRNSSEVDVLSFFAANSANGSTFNDMADWFCQGFASFYGFDYNREASHVLELQRAALTLRPSRKLVLFIDGINQIVATDGTGIDLSWWPRWNENIYVIVSTPSDVAIANNLSRFQFRKLEITKFNLGQRVDLANKYLKGDFNKSLSPSQLDIIGRANPLLDNTLVYVSFLDEIRRYGSFEKLTDEITMLSSFKTITEFFGHIIDRQRALFHTPELADQYNKVLMAIALSYCGLSENELLDLTGMSRLNLSMLLGINSLNLTVKDGKIVFAHNAFKDVIMNLVCSNDGDSIRREIISSHVDGEEDSIFEISYQYYMLEDYDNLYLMHSKMSTFKLYSAHGKLNELGRYWVKLISVNPYRYDILNVIYNEMVSESSAIMTGMMFYLVISTQSRNIIDLSNFVLNNIEKPDVAKRLNNALIKMLENEHEGGFDEIREAAKQNMAVMNRKGGDWSLALRKYRESINKDTDMASAVISNIGELFLTMYERTRSKPYADYSQKILKEVLETRIKKLGTEEHESVAVAYANYASAISITDFNYGLELEKKSLAIFERLKGYYNIDVAIQYGNIAKQLLTKDNEESIRYGEKALEIYKVLQGEEGESTLEMHWHLALAYKENRELDASWQHTLAAYSFRCTTEEGKKDFVFLLKLLLSEFYREKNYEKAQEVGLYALSLIGEDEPASRSFHDDLGKVFHVMGMEELSDKHYEKSIELSINNEFYDKAQNTLCFYSQKCFANGETDKAQLLLRRIIEIHEKYCLEESTILSYAYYNLGLAMFAHDDDRDGAIKMIERAIEIRQQLVDDDESDLVEYRSTLEKIQGGMSAGIDTTGENSRHAINVMTMILGDTNRQALEAFSEGMNAFDRGNIDQASHMLKMAQTYLDDQAPSSAYAQVVHYLAYCDEMVYSHTDGAKGNVSDIFSQYETARMLAQADENYLLAAEICHDAAMFCSGQGYYGSSEICYWRKFENLLSAGSLLSLDASMTLYNLSMVINRQGNNDTDILLSLTSLALYVYNNCEESNDDLKERLEGNYQSIIENIQDEEVVSIDEWGVHTWSMKSHVRKLEDFDSEKLASMLMKLTSEYFKETGNLTSYAVAHMHYINSLLPLSEFTKAMGEIEIFMKEYAQYLDDEDKNYAITISYILALSVHDFARADEICENYSISDEIKQQYMEIFTPCTYAFLNHDNEKAEKLYSELQEHLDQGKLNESQFFDLATYCAYKQAPYEGKKFMSLWKDCISGVPKEDFHYYEPAIDMLKNLLEQ